MLSLLTLVLDWMYSEEDRMRPDGTFAVFVALHEVKATRGFMKTWPSLQFAEKRRLFSVAFTISGDPAKLEAFGLELKQWQNRMRVDESL